MNNNKFKWGIIGAGNIARTFVNAINIIPNAEIQAVASRSIDRAKGFANEFGIKEYYDNYEELVSKPDIDGVYIATTNPYHYDAIILCLNNGKPVMCEKPMCLNSTQTEHVIKLAKEKGLFLMEAVWSRFLPIYKEIDKLIEEGEIGDIKVVKAAIGFSAPWADDDRHVDIKNGGGALLDVGIYNLAFACKYIGREPVEVVSSVAKYKTGVDETSTVILKYPDNKMAILTSSIAVMMPHDGYLFGTKGSISLPFYWRTEKAVLSKFGKPFTPPQMITIEADFEGGNGYQYEIIDAMKRIRNGELESSYMPLADTLAISKIMTELRKEWGIVYEGHVGEVR